MSTLKPQFGIFYVADPRILQPDIDTVEANTVEANTGIFDNLQLQGTTLVTTDGSQTLTNKQLVDSSTFIVDSTDNTKKLQFDVASSSTSTALLRFSNSTSRAYNFPDVSADTDVLFTQGSQTVSGPLTVAGNTISSSGITFPNSNAPASRINAYTTTILFSQGATTVNATVYAYLFNNQAILSIPITNMISPGGLASINGVFSDFAVGSVLASLLDASLPMIVTVNGNPELQFLSMSASGLNLNFVRVTNANYAAGDSINFGGTFTYLTAVPS